MKKDNKSVILLTLGDPTGIGPEIVLRALSRFQYSQSSKLICIGSARVLRERERALGNQGIRITIVDANSLNEAVSSNQNSIFMLDVTKSDKHQYVLGHPDAESGILAVDSVLFAIDALKGFTDFSLVTTPISKYAIQLGKYSCFKGHNEIFKEKFETSQIINMLITFPFEDNPLRLVHVTSHVPLREVSNILLSPKGIELIVQTTELTYEGLLKMRIKDPRIVITGFNPHLEEWGDELKKGMLGKEEECSIQPAVDILKVKGLTVHGPMTADSAYRHARMGEYDAVVSMYHDQSHIVANSDPKGFATSIIVTLGLPFLRLSTSHGPAVDIADKFNADARPIENCIKYIMDH